MSQQRATQPLTQGALLAALTALLGIMSLGFPPLRFITDFLWGIPIIIVITKHNLRLGIMVLGVSLLLLLFVFNPISVLLFAVRMAPLALVYGFLIKKRVLPGKSLVIGTLVAAIAEVVTILGFLYLAGINIIPPQEELKQVIDQAIKFYEEVGLFELYAKQGLSVETIKDTFYQVAYLYALLIPAAFVLSSIIRAFLTWIVAQRVLNRMGFSVGALPKFSEWSLPWYWIWLLTIGLLATIVGDHYGLETLAIAGKNMVAITCFIYLVIGLAIAVSFIKNWKVPGWFKVLIVIIIIINLSGTIILFTLLGIFDSFVVFRRFQKVDK